MVNPCAAQVQAVCQAAIFGNTEKATRAMGAAFEARAEVAAVRVGDVTPEHLPGVNTLIVGSPTRAFNPTPAIKSWLKNLAPCGLEGVKVAAFDTRIALSDVNSRILPVFVKLLGYAAEPMAAQMIKKGETQVLPPDATIRGLGQDVVFSTTMGLTNTWPTQRRLC